MSHPNAASEILPENRAETNDVEFGAEAPNAHQPPPAPIEAAHLASSAHQSNAMTSRPPTIRSSENAGDDGIASGGGTSESKAACPEDPVQAAGTQNTPSQRGTYVEEAPLVSAQSRRTLGIPKADLSRGTQKINAMGGGDGGFIGAFDYDKKYPVDEYGKEMEPDARIWKIYVDEAAEDDRFRIENLRDTLDVILVFAGLFSAVVTTFVVHTVESLEDDGQMTKTESLLTELICIQRSAASGIPLESCGLSFSVQQPSSANPSTSDYAVNALFFFSLAVALCTALAAVLAKQWIHHRLQPVPGSPQDRARKHQFRVDGFTRYQVESIIGLLPVLIHLSLFLFFIGLGIFLSTLHVVTTAVVVSITGITLALYLVSNVLPIFDVQCPYHTPLTTAIHEGPFRLFKIPFFRFKQFVLSRRTYHSNYAHGEGITHASLKAREVESIKKHGQYWDVRCLGWLQTTTTDAKVYTAAFSAFAGLPRPLTKEAIKELHRPNYLLAFRQELRTALSHKRFHDEGTVERFARAATICAPYFSQSDVVHKDIRNKLLLYVTENLGCRSLMVTASLYSLQLVFGMTNMVLFDGYPNFFISFVIGVIDHPIPVHPTVLSHLLVFAPQWGTRIKDCLTLKSNSVSPGNRYRDLRDKKTSLEFLMKLADLSHSPHLRAPHQLPAREALTCLTSQIFPIPSISAKMVKDVFTYESYKGCSLYEKWHTCRALSAVHILAHLPLPVGDAELQMFGSTNDHSKHLGYGWTPGKDISLALSPALANVIQSVLNSDKGPPPESWKVVFRIAYYAFFYLKLDTKECVQALHDFGERVGADLTFGYIHFFKNNIRGSESRAIGSVI